MSWLLFYLLVALHPVAFIVIGFASKSWKVRLLLWALLPVPAAIYCREYFVIKHEHEKLCAAEGGLRISIEPEKSDQVRLVGDGYRSGNAQGLLERYYPKLRVVESMSGDRDGSGKIIQRYVRYTAEPNPKVGMPMDKDPWTEPKLVFVESAIESLSPAVYEITQYESTIRHGSVTETRLSKDGKIYAKYSEFVHWWTGIRYPDALPTWRCPDQRPPDEILPYRPLVKLILK